jgi:hypothetical protein
MSRVHVAAPSELTEAALSTGGLKADKIDATSMVITAMMCIAGRTF